MTFVPDLRPSVVAACFGVALAAAVAASSPAAVAACNGFGLTPGQIGGTHFKSSPVRHSVLVGEIQGTHITLSGYVLTLNAHDPFFDRRLLVRLRIVKHRFQARFDFVLGRV
jgi:hydrogenase/urease accessory protein HupE